MKALSNEEVIWTSKNKKLILTSHRLRLEDSSLFGSRIKSIMLSELSYSELETKWDLSYLRRALYIFIGVNLSIFLLNNYLFEAELFKLFFETVHIGPETTATVFYLSLLLGSVLVLMSILSFKKVFAFYAADRSIRFQLRWFTFEERENFISLVEQTKDQYQSRSQLNNT